MSLCDMFGSDCHEMELSRSVNSSCLAEKRYCRLHRLVLTNVSLFTYMGQLSSLHPSTTLLQRMVGRILGKVLRGGDCGLNTGVRAFCWQRRTFSSTTNARTKGLKFLYSYTCDRLLTLYRSCTTIYGDVVRRTQPAPVNFQVKIVPASPPLRSA